MCVCVRVCVKKEILRIYIYIYIYIFVFVCVELICLIVHNSLTFAKSRKYPV